MKLKLIAVLENQLEYNVRINPKQLIIVFRIYWLQTVCMLPFRQIFHHLVSKIFRGKDFRGKKTDKKLIIAVHSTKLITSCITFRSP